MDIKNLKDAMSPPPGLPENIETAKDLVSQDPLGKAVEQVKQEASVGIAQMQDTIETGASAANLALGEVLETVERIVSPMLQQAKQQLQHDHSELIRQEVDEFFAKAGETLPGELKAMIQDNLRQGEPTWAELNQMNDLLFQAFPDLPGIPPQILDTQSKEHDGESYVVFTDENGKERKGKLVEENGQNYVVYQDDEGNMHKEPLEDEVYYTNGIQNSPENAESDGRALSRETGRPVVVTYNAREGFGPDILQCITDKADPFGMKFSNPATDRNEELMYEAAKGGEEKDFVYHSQGGIIGRNALMRVHARLYTEKFAETWNETHDPVASHREAWGYADDRVKNIHVVTAGGAAWAWPPYANEDHVSNTWDIVPGMFGQNALLDPRETVRETFGIDVAWLPTTDRVDVVNEQPTTENPVAHSFSQTYLDDVAKKV